MAAAGCRAPDGDRPENRYERARPGELVHIDVKKLGKVAGVGHRITGDRRKDRARARERLGVRARRVDDCTRLAYVEVLADEAHDTARVPGARRRLVRAPGHASSA